MVAEVAREMEILTIGVVTKPFLFEGRIRMKNAEHGVEELMSKVDTLVTVPNDRLLQVVSKGTSVVEAFEFADDVLRQAIQGISDLIAVPSLINLDFADVKTIMRDKGIAHMGIGVSAGEDRTLEAARQAMESPLLETTISGAHDVLLNITGGPGLGLVESNEAAQLVMESASDDANIIYGTGIDDQLGDQVRITIIATGFNMKREDKAPASEEKPDYKLNTLDNSDFKKASEIFSKEDRPRFAFKFKNQEEEEGEDIQGDNLDIPTFLRKPRK